LNQGVLKGQFAAATRIIIS